MISLVNREYFVADPYPDPTFSIDADLDPDPGQAPVTNF
jgi:hypothetical protein